MLELDTSLKNQIDSLPKLPGCYLYKDSEGNIIYVGKAKNLLNRVRSYFTNYDRLDPKTQTLIENIDSLDYVTVDTETDALILETNLIKKYKPKFNRMMIDDKNYSFIKITKELIPRIKVVREIKEDKAEYFGPYPSQFPAKEVLRNIRKIFPYRTCNRSMLRDDSDNIICSDKKPCLYYRIGLCQAPCANKISISDYKKSILDIAKFLRGEKSGILQNLEKDLAVSAKKLEFERASVLRDKIMNIRSVLRNINIGTSVDDIYVAKQKELEKKNAVRELFFHLDIPYPENRDFIKIECYDISNLQGTNAVGAMVVMIDGVPRPDLYKKFRIRSKDTPDDFLMHQEMMSRRLARAEETLHSIEGRIDHIDNSWDLPDLFIIDGGKPQLTSIVEIFQKYSLPISNLTALAKREEILYMIDEENSDLEEKVYSFKEVKLSQKSEALKLVQRIRDESHRFGISYHRKLRSKQFLQN